jgi:uncharacterized protein (DUF1501 family)
MIQQNYNATVYNISLGGFDTHSNQLDQHASLLRMLSEAIFSFQQDLNKHGLADRVLTVIQSEFGRTLKENDELGTDHGLTNHVLVVGNSAKGGIYGISELIQNHQFDFRQIYATIFERWLECSSGYILGKKWTPVDFLTDPRLCRSG